MSDPVYVPYRLEVLKRITTLLQGITAENGYAYDLSAAVFRGRTVYGEGDSDDGGDPLPMISILEDPRPDPGVWAGEDEARQDIWKILLQGFAKDDKTNPLDPAYELMAAVEHRLSLIVAKNEGTGFRLNNDHYHLDGLIAGIKIGPGICRPPDGKLSSKAFFYLPLRISLARPVGSPYISS